MQESSTPHNGPPFDHKPNQPGNLVTEAQAPRSATVSDPAVRQVAGMEPARLFPIIVLLSLVTVEYGRGRP
jgi:hypothetical protein